MADADERSSLLEDPSALLRQVDKGMLVDLLQAFTSATGLTANIVNTRGASIFSRADAQNMCEFCKIVRALERKKGVRRCAGAYERAGKQAAKFGEPYIFRCPAGLVEWIAPIVRNGIHIGSIVCGQVLLWEPEEFFWFELESMNREITDDVQPLIDAAQELQVISAEKVQAASQLLTIMANYIFQNVWDAIKQKNEAEYQKRLLNEEISTRRELERKLNSQGATYFYDQTNDLVSALRNEEFDRARSIFRVISADVIAQSPDFEHAHARIFELLVTISHAAIESGVDSDACMQANLDYCSAERFVDNFESLKNLAEQSFERHVASMEKRSNPSSRAVNDMRAFIRSHFRQDITLADVADSVQLSPYYAGRIFKAEQGIGVMEYVTRMRMEEAKTLLANPKYRVEEIAQQLGFEDPSYFARVFKKCVGMTPSKYRNNH